MGILKERIQNMQASCILYLWVYTPKLYVCDVLHAIQFVYIVYIDYYHEQAHSLLQCSYDTN